MNSQRQRSKRPTVQLEIHSVHKRTLAPCSVYELISRHSVFPENQLAKGFSASSLALLAAGMFCLRKSNHYAGPRR